MSTFIEWLNTAGAIFCRHAFWMLIQTGLLFAILWGLDRLLRPIVRASFRYSLWLLILIKLLLPVDFRLPSGLGYWMQLPDETKMIVSEYTPDFQTSQPKSADPIKTDRPSARPETSDPQSSTPSITHAPLVSQPTQLRLTVSGLLFAVWIIGTLCLVAALVYQILSVRRLLMRSHDVSDAVSAIFAQCCKRMQMTRSVRLTQSDETPIPAVCGLLHPTVLIPSSLIEKLDEEKLLAVLIHELGHIQRKDLWVNMIQMILQLFYFYNPFVRLANHWIRKTREQANDEHVLVQLNGRRQIYSNTLIDVAAGAVARPSLAIRMIGVAEPKTQLHERITLMMQKPIPTKSTTGFLGIAALIALAFILLPMAAGPTALAEKMNAVTTPLTKEQAIDQQDKLVATMIEAFNDGDLDRFLSPYAEDAIFLADQQVMALGATGMRLAFSPEFSNQTKVLEHNYTYHELWSCGNYLISASQDKLAIQLGELPQMLTLLRNYLTIYQVQPDGTLKIKIEALNMADPQSIADLPDTPATPIFHQVKSEPISDEALTEILEKVKQLDIDFHDYFNKQDPATAVTYYAPNAMLMSVGKNPLHGPDEILEFVYEGSQDAQHINNNQQVIHVEGNDQIVIVVNQFGWIFKDTQTGQLASIPGKGIHVWQKQPDGSWKILLDIHNTNVPLS